MTRAVCVLMGALASAAVGAMVSGQEQPLIVAYMTGDGELVPVARYDGTHWTNTWPEPISDDAPVPVRRVDEIPRAWLGQAVPLTWFAWSEGIGKPRRVTVTGVDRDGACVQAITLATSPRPDPPSDGLALDRPTAVDAMVAIEQGSPERDRLRRDVTPHFRTAVAKGAAPDAGELGARAFALGRADGLAEADVVVDAAFRDPRFPIFFIEAERRFSEIPSDTDYDALSYGGWFRWDAAGTLVPISAAVMGMSTAEGKLPRYEPIGIVRLGNRSIWALSEFGNESQTIVLFEVSAEGVRKLTSADISGC